MNQSPLPSLTVNEWSTFRIWRMLTAVLHQCPSPYFKFWELSNVTIKAFGFFWHHLLDELLSRGFCPTESWSFPQNGKGTFFRPRFSTSPFYPGGHPYLWPLWDRLSYESWMTHQGSSGNPHIPYACLKTPLHLFFPPHPFKTINSKQEAPRN